MSDFIFQLGETKWEQLEKNFVQTHKETGIEIIKSHGWDVFGMWWYINSLCFGREKVTAFPSYGKMSEDIGFSVSTLQRCLRKLEKIKAIKRVTIYNKNGARTSNLLIVNSSFPEVPEFWDEAYKHGAYQVRFQSYVELKSAEDKPWANYIGEKNQQNGTGHMLPGGPVRYDRGVQSDMTGGVQSDMTGGGEDEIPEVPTVQEPDFETEEQEGFKNINSKNINSKNNNKEEEKKNVVVQEELEIVKLFKDKFDKDIKENEAKTLIKLSNKHNRDLHKVIEETYQLHLVKPRTNPAGYVADTIRHEREVTKPTLPEQPKENKKDCSKLPSAVEKQLADAEAKRIQEEKERKMTTEEKQALDKKREEEKKKEDEQIKQDSERIQKRLQEMRSKRGVS